MQVRALYLNLIKKCFFDRLGAFKTERLIRIYKPIWKNIDIKGFRWWWVNWF